MKKNYKNKGALAVEVIVATAIITVSVLAAMSVVQRSLYVARQSLHVSEASYLLEEGAEVTRLLRDNNWSNISSLSVSTNYYPSFSGTAWSLSTTPTNIGIFTRTVIVSNVNRDSSSGNISASGTNDPGTRLVTITVTWNDGQGNLSRTLSFYLTNIFS